MTPTETFTAYNNAGQGYAVGSEDASINELAKELNAELVEPSRSNDEVAVYRCRDGGTILVGDCHGPWAIHLA